MEKDRGKNRHWGCLKTAIVQLKVVLNLPTTITLAFCLLLTLEQHDLNYTGLFIRGPLSISTAR